MSILEINKECFLFLYNYKFEEEKLLFVPRRRDTKNQKMEGGYYFIGNNKYLQISFWDGQDWKEKIHNISVVILENGTSYIEISARDDKEKALLLRKLVKELETYTTLSFEERKENKWKAHLDGADYIGNLERFILVEKRIIDIFVKDNCEGKIEPLDEKFYDKNVEVIKNKYFSAEEIGPEKLPKNKKEGQILINKAEYNMNLYHNKLQNKLVEVLKATGQYSEVLSEVDNVDIIGIKKDGEKDFFEVKPYKPKLAIRLAIGQLLEYCHYPNNNKAIKMFVIADCKPEDADIHYLNYIREKYSLPLFYLHFDLFKGEISNEY